MIMSNVTAFVVQNTSSEVRVHSPSAESIAIYRVFDELRNGPTDKVELTSRDDFAGQSVRRYSSMPNISVQTTSAGDSGGIDRFTVRRRRDTNDFRRVVKWPDRNGCGKLCQSKVPLLYISLVNTAIRLPPKSRSRPSVCRRMFGRPKLTCSSQAVISRIRRDAVLSGNSSVD